MKRELKYIISILAILVLIGSCEEEEENREPTCSITSPTSSAEITRGDIVTISVEADDADGNLEEIRFYIDNIGIGSASSFPYKYDWETQNEEVGKHYIKVEVIDSKGNTSTDQVTVTINQELFKITGYVKNSQDELIEGAEISLEIDDGSNKKSEISNNQLKSKNIRSRYQKLSNSMVDWILDDKSLIQPSSRQSVLNNPKNELLKTITEDGPILTNENGYYEITDIASGEYILSISCEDYEVYEESIKIIDKSIEQDVTLSSELLPHLSNIILTDETYKIKVSWPGIENNTLQGYNNYEQHVYWYNMEGEEDELYFYPVYTDWAKTNSSLIENSPHNYTSEEYNGKYGDKVLPVNVDGIESEENSNTDIDYIELPKKRAVLASFPLTGSSVPVYIPNSTHEITLHMRYYYDDPTLTNYVGSWKVLITTDGDNWSTLATNSVFVDSRKTYGYIKSFSLNAYKGQLIALKTDPEAFPNANYTYEIENIVAAYSQDGSDFETGDPPVADFQANQTTATEGELVSFTDLTSNDPIGWSWNFGDGQTSASQNPSHSYSASGTYTVSLTATNQYGTDIETKTDYITVEKSGSTPIAAFTANQTIVETSGSVSFTDQSTNDPTSWSWNFGDGSTSTLQNPSHTYNATGIYTVTLTVTNNYGSDTETKTSYINVGSAPVSSFTANETTVAVGESVNFTDQSSNNPTSWSWDFGDGSTSTLRNPSHTYNTAGAYTISLTTTNSFGSDIETKTNYITIGSPPSAEFIADQTIIMEGEVVSFTDQTTNNPTSWLWNFGDGTTSTFQNPSHTYNVAGAYNVSLTTTNSFGSDVETKINYITVGSLPIAEFTADQTTIIEGESVSFTDQTTNNPTSWLWNFGDGITSTSQNLSHTYSTVGTYTISLTATNNFGSDIETKTDYILVTHETGIVMDYDGNTYNTVKIGNQWWMAENLKTTHYTDGTAIQLIENGTNWATLGDNDEAMCYYNNSTTNKNIYGALYTWSAAVNGVSSSSSNPSGVQGVCPDGWHMPSDAEWTELFSYLGGTGKAGGKMKEVGTTHWNSPNYGATNESGFTALPAAYRNTNGVFNYLGYGAYFWSTTTTYTYGNNQQIFYDENDIIPWESDKSTGFSVRCVKD